MLILKAVVAKRIMSILPAILPILGECIALWGEPYELSIQHRVYIFMQYVDS